MAKRKPKGTCDACGNSPRALTQILSGDWVCVTCLREIRGAEHPKDLAKPEQVADLRERGFSVPDELPKAEYKRCLVMDTLRKRGVHFNPASTLEELEDVQSRTDVRHFPARVVGVTFANPDGTSPQEIIWRCSPGARVRLKHEKDNPVDPNAVAVLTMDGEQMGHLSAELAAEVVERSRRGWQYSGVIQEIRSDGVVGHSVGVLLALVVAGPLVCEATILDYLGQVSDGFAAG